MKGKNSSYKKKDFPSDSLNDSLSDYSGIGPRGKFEENFEDSLQDFEEEFYADHQHFNNQYGHEFSGSEQRHYRHQHSSEKVLSEKDSLQSRRNSVGSGRHSHGSSKINMVLMID
jgi:hypothetical protein